MLFFTAVKTPATSAQRHLLPAADVRAGELRQGLGLGIKTYFMNSRCLTVLKVPTGVFICSLAAFALAKMRMRGAKALFTISSSD